MLFRFAYACCLFLFVSFCLLIHSFFCVFVSLLVLLRFRLLFYFVSFVFFVSFFHLVVVRVSFRFVCVDSLRVAFVLSFRVSCRCSFLPCLLLRLCFAPCFVYRSFLFMFLLVSFVCLFVCFLFVRLLVASLSLLSCLVAVYV